MQSDPKTWANDDSIHNPLFAQHNDQHEYTNIKTERAYNNQEKDHIYFKQS